MFYRIRIDLAFHSEDAPKDIKDKALDHFIESFTINPGLPNEERGYIIVHKCYHDEHPGTPCDVIEEHWTPD